MKCLLVLLSLVTISLAASDEQKNEIRNIGKECKQSTGVEKEILIKLKNGEIVDDPKLKTFIGCLFDKLKFRLPGGEIDADKAKARLPAGLSEEQKDAIINECLKLKGDDNDDTAFKIYKCYRNKSSKSHADLLI